MLVSPNTKYASYLYQLLEDLHLRSPLFMDIIRVDVSSTELKLNTIGSLLIPYGMYGPILSGSVEEKSFATINLVYIVIM